MDRETARKLNLVNREFYAANAQSFSDTRSRPWRGWEILAERVRAVGVPDSAEVLDVACGNMRFERFAAAEFPSCDIRFTCLDSSEGLASMSVGRGEDAPCADVRAGFPRGGTAGKRPLVSFRRFDVVEALLDGQGLGRPFGAHCRDAAVSFGFMHHVPGFENRLALLGALVDSVRPGGYVAVSFWRFLEDGRLAEKARAQTERAMDRLGFSFGGEGGLEPGDRFLGWQRESGAFRYCHHFDDAEIDALAQGVSVRARVVTRFAADGRDGASNCYLVLQVV